MTTQPEHVQAPGLIRVTELVGVSNKGWEDAARQAVEQGLKGDPAHHGCGCAPQHSDCAR